MKEETGLDIITIQGKEKRIDSENRGDISSIIEPFCVTQMKNGPFIGLIFICKTEGQLLQKTAESKEARWIEIDELKVLVNEHEELFYTPFLTPLKKYLQMNSLKK